MHIIVAHSQVTNANLAIGLWFISGCKIKKISPLSGYIILGTDAATAYIAEDISNRSSVPIR